MIQAIIYQLTAHVVEKRTDDNGTSSIIFRDKADTWGISFNERNPQYAFWVAAVEQARASLHVRDALNATISMLYTLSTIGLHDAKLSNDLAEATNEAIARIRAAVGKIEAMRTPEEVAADAKDDEDWLKRSQVLDGMRKEKV